MTRNDCASLRPDLGAFIDGELSGTARQRVAQHLEHCDACAGEAKAFERIGSWLRDETGVDVPEAIDGALSGVVARYRAETAQSWRAMYARAIDNWHWAIVGGGSVAATFLSTAFLALILAFGPRPEREDSLQALITNLGSPAGILFVYATPGGVGGDSMLMQFDNGEPATSRANAALATPPGARPASERELVGQLSEAVTRSGRVIELNNMHPAERLYTEALLTEIARIRLNAVGISSLSRNSRVVDVHQVILLTSTSVTAKGL